MPSQAGRTAVVTGANSGLGLATARALAAAGAQVVLACRDTAKGEAAAQQIRDRTPGASVIVEPLDLASLDSVRAFAERLVSGCESLDLLINNAGVMAPPQRARPPTASSCSSAPTTSATSPSPLLLLPRMRGAQGCARRHRQQHRPQSRPDPVRRPAERAQLRALARLLPVEARQRPLRPRARPAPARSRARSSPASPPTPATRRPTCRRRRRRRSTAPSSPSPTGCSPRARRWGRCRSSTRRPVPTSRAASSSAPTASRSSAATRR